MMTSIGSVLPRVVVEVKAVAPIGRLVINVVVGRSDGAPMMTSAGSVPNAELVMVYALL